MNLKKNTTMEEIKVIKRNGSIEPFNDAKVISTVKNALDAIGIESSEGFINYVKKKIKERVEKTEENIIYSEEISAFILNALLEEDLMWVYSSWIKFNKRDYSIDDKYGF